MEKKHNDCLNFTAIDVAKGICRVNNQVVFTDSNVCPNFEVLPKCKTCTCFKNADEDNIGCCTGFKKEAWTYGELNATTCENYKEI